MNRSVRCNAGAVSLPEVPTNGGHAVQIDKSAASIAIESADGKYVYFARDKKLWRAKTDGSTAEQVAGMPEFNSLARG